MKWLVAKMGWESVSPQRTHLLAYVPSGFFRISAIVQRGIIARWSVGFKFSPQRPGFRSARKPPSASLVGTAESPSPGPLPQPERCRWRCEEEMRGALLYA